VTFTPTSIPLLQRVETADGRRGLISSTCSRTGGNSRSDSRPTTRTSRDRRRRDDRGGCGSRGGAARNYDCDLQLDFDGTEVVARHFGGGTAGLGFVYAHVFETSDLPQRMVVRRPATDGGPPLVEVELCPRSVLPDESKL
jgi:hypothetical protein